MLAVMKVLVLLRFAQCYPPYNAGMSSLPVDGQLVVKCSDPAAFAASSEAKAGVLAGIADVGGVSVDQVDAYISAEHHSSVEDYVDGTMGDETSERRLEPAPNVVAVDYSIAFAVGATTNGFDVTATISSTPLSELSTTIATEVDKHTNTDFQVSVTNATADTKEPGPSPTLAPTTAAPSNEGMPIWGWVLIGVGIAGLIALVAVIVCCGGNGKKRTKRGLKNKAAKEEPVTYAAPAEPVHTVSTSVPVYQPMPQYTYEVPAPIYAQPMPVYAAPVASSQPVYAAPVASSQPVYAAPVHVYAQPGQHEVLPVQHVAPVASSQPVYAAPYHVYAQPGQHEVQPVQHVYH